VDATAATLHEISEAKKAVEPFVGAMDVSMAVTAGGVYLAALKRLGHDTRGLAGNTAGAKSMFHALKRVTPPPSRPQPSFHYED
jgi:hypothetical protein